MSASIVDRVINNIGGICEKNGLMVCHNQYSEIDTARKFVEISN